MYDLIGDIHGHAAELTSLLELLGYVRQRGYYSQPARKAVFAKDLWVLVASWAGSTSAVERVLHSRCDLRGFYFRTSFQTSGAMLFPATIHRA